MKRTTSIKKLMNAIKKDTGYKKAVQPQVKRLDGVRDMRQEAIDMGSHGAADMFGGKQ